MLDSEIIHHIRKLNQAVLDGDRAKVTEYAADVACYAMKYFERFEDFAEGNITPANDSEK